jgi:2,3-diaminopropionate biosynthesis protein SbnB
MKFDVVSGVTVDSILSTQHSHVIEKVALAYQALHHGDAANPSSYFLRFEKIPGARIIALPAHIDDPVRVAGIKWISSFPTNLGRDLPRASAVLILNDSETGYPFACLESSIISAARTAASAVLASYHLNGRHKAIDNLGIIGTGLIARYILDYFVGSGWQINRISVFDLNRAYADKFKRRIVADYPQIEQARITVKATSESVIAQSDLVAFTTTAGEPHVSEVACFSHNPIVLHISLRDLAPQIIIESHNVVDDVNHCLTAQTSLHLTEQKLGRRDFVHGTLAQILDGGAVPKRDRPIIFSPFGMGILDLVVGYYVYQVALARGETFEVPGFFHRPDRSVIHRRKEKSSVAVAVSQHDADGNGKHPAP